MNRVEEQRVCIKFCLEKGKTCAETLQMLRTALGEDSLSEAVVYQWYRRFKGPDAFNDLRSGRPSTDRNEEIIAQVREKSRADRRLTIREISKEIDISFGSCQAILSNAL